MRTINDGGPAFPIPLTDDQEQEWNRSMGGVSANGMSLRDYFAAHCPITIEEAVDIAIGAEELIAGERKLDDLLRFYADLRLRYADAMLAARDKP
jgi:hypothetical protein